MKIKLKSWLLACGMVLSVGSPVFAQQICDPAAAPFTPGSCQVTPNNFPGCWVCQAIPGTPNQCVPDDSVCNDISGGNSSSECRVGACTATALTPSNPSGCDYSFTPDSNPDVCLNCEDPLPADFSNCGNGICEPGLGEGCGNCSIDCRLPGFDGSPDNPGLCPLPANDAVYFNACELGIVFGGPPYNQFGTCEDGDLCTDNECDAGGFPDNICTSTPKSCSINNQDFCCPAGCNPPAANADCGPNDANCDIDCYIPQSCQPTPSPTPTPPPVFAGCLEGGGGWGEKGGPGCGGAACSLNTAASAIPGFGFFLSLGGAFALGAYRNLRRRS